MAQSMPIKPGALPRLMTGNEGVIAKSWTEDGGTASVATAINEPVAPPGAKNSRHLGIVSL